MLSLGQFLGDALGLEFRAFCSALFELVDSPSHIQEVLLARVERMAIGTNFNMEFLFSGTRSESVAASANNLGVSEILWVEVFFHSQKIVAHSFE